MKTCSRCGVQRDPVFGFHKDKNRQDGLSLWCKPCVKEHQSRYRELYAERRRAERKANPKPSKRGKHGDCRNGVVSTPEYRSWLSMRYRCSRPSHRSYPNYGGRGIKVCDRWNDYRLFLEDMGRKPFPGATIDRIDSDGNYEPENCRWASNLEQQANKRRNIRLTFAGKTQHLAAWAREVGIDEARIRWRLDKGWSVEKALTQRIGPSGPKRPKD